jgi:hypothetical protein
MAIKIGYSISDISAIKSLPTALLTNGYARLCRSVNAWFSYNSTSTAAADDVSVLLPASGTGRWFKLKADVAATDVLNFNESVDDRVAALVQNSSTINASYNDAANTLTFSVIAGSIDETELTDSGVIAGSYINATITVDSKGRVISATSGASGFANPMTTLGDLIVGGTSGTPTRFAGNTTTQIQVLSQTGNGSISATPVWRTLIKSDISDLANFTYTVAGLVPAPTGSGTSRYLREDGSWGTPSGSAASITVLNKDATLTSAATSFNFKGAGVEATNTGGDVTITIPYSNKSGYELISENLSVPLVFYWDDYYALPVNYVTKNRFSVVGTEPLRNLLDNTTGLRFLGASSGHYAIANSVALQITGNITYFAVIQTGVIPSTNSSALQGILVKQTGVAGGIGINIAGANFYAEFSNNSGTTFTITSSLTLTSNAKYTVLIYRNGANCYLNVNGTVDSISTFTGTNIVQSDPLRLGNKVSTTFGFEGIIQMAGICNGAVSSTDITFLLGLDYTKFPYL